MHVSSSCLLIPRLWYENPGVFTSAQRASLSRASLGRIICDNTGILTVPRDPFRIPDNGNNRLIACNTIQQLNLQAWRERPTEAKQQNQDHNQQEDQNYEQQQQDQDNEVICLTSV